MKGMKLYKKAAGGYLSALEESKPELFKTIKNYRDRLSGGEQETFDKRANIQYAATMNMPKSQRDAYISSIEKEYSKPTDAQFKQVKSSLGQKFKPTYTYIAKDSDKPAATTGYYRDLSSEIAEADKKLKALTLTESKTRQVPVYTYYEGASGPPGLAGSRPGVARQTTQIPKGSTYSPGGGGGGLSVPQPAGYRSPTGQFYSKSGTRNVTETFTRPQRAGDEEYDKQFSALQRLQKRHDNRFLYHQYQPSKGLTGQNVYSNIGLSNTQSMQPKPFVNPYASYGTTFGTAKKGGAVKMSKGGKAAIRGKRFTGVY
jgi:hypothetical protein